MKTYYPTLTERCQVEGCGLELTEKEADALVKEFLNHEHVLVKCLTKWGWECAIKGCDYFKSHEEFDNIEVTNDNG